MWGTDQAASVSISGLKDLVAMIRKINLIIGDGKKRILKDEIKTMSHPSGSYNKSTLKILKDLGIELGFKQIMTKEPEKGMKKVNNSSLEIAREDHADIIKQMKNRK